MKFTLIILFPDCLENNYKTEEDRFQKVFISLVLNFFLSFIVNLHDVLEYLLKEINSEVCICYVYYVNYGLLICCHPRYKCIEIICIFSVFVFQAINTLQSSLKKLTNQSNSNSLLLENILLYCDDLKTIR